MPAAGRLTGSLAVPLLLFRTALPTWNERAPATAPAGAGATPVPDSGAVLGPALLATSISAVCAPGVEGVKLAVKSQLSPGFSRRPRRPSARTARR